MAKIGSHRLAARMLGSQPSDRGSSPRESICPHCKNPFAPPGDEVILTADRNIDDGDFTVCLDCREIIRFDSSLKLRAMEEHDWLDLIKEKELFVAMLRFRLHLLISRGKNESTNPPNGIPSIGKI